MSLSIAQTHAISICMLRVDSEAPLRLLVSEATLKEKQGGHESTYHAIGESTYHAIGESTYHAIGESSSFSFLYVPLFSPSLRALSISRCCAVFAVPPKGMGIGAVSPHIQYSHHPCTPMPSPSVCILCIRN